jgi:hypothetical protein
MSHVQLMLILILLTCYLFNIIKSDMNFCFLFLKNNTNVTNSFILCFKIPITLISPDSPLHLIFRPLFCGVSSSPALLFRCHQTQTHHTLHKTHFLQTMKLPSSSSAVKLVVTVILILYTNPKPMPSAPAPPSSSCQPPPPFAAS